LPSATIYVFEVSIDEPATEFVAVDEMIALDCDVTPGAAGGGTYKWSADTDGGTADTDMVTFSPDSTDLPISNATEDLPIKLKRDALEDQAYQRLSMPFFAAFVFFVVLHYLHRSQ